MAPRTGPRGVTNEDVARRAGVSYVYAPTTNQPPPIDASTLANFLIGGQAPGYGMKYGGFPSAAYGQAAITGQAYQIADLARQAQELAAMREIELGDIAASKIAPERLAMGAKYRYDYRPNEAMRNVGAAFNKAETPLQRMLAQAQLQSAVESQRASRQQELTAREAPILAQYESDVAQQVAPARSLAEALGSFTPSQLAQQIAVSRYGYDPMLASGLFGAQTNLDYADQQQAIQDAERRAMGYNTGLSTDEILAQQLSPEAYQAYQIAKATAAYQNVTEPDYTQQDRDLQAAYGVSPTSISGIDAPTVREAMADDQFYQSVLSYREALKTNDEDYASAEEAANSMARDYLEKTGDPVRAQILLDILRQYSFTFGG